MGLNLDLYFLAKNLKEFFTLSESQFLNLKTFSTSPANWNSEQDLIYEVCGEDEELNRQVQGQMARRSLPSAIHFPGEGREDMNLRDIYIQTPERLKCEIIARDYEGHYSAEKVLSLCWHPRKCRCGRSLSPSAVPGPNPTPPGTKPI